MIRKFDCKNCKKQFEADDSNVVKCPYCNNDNVEFAKHRIPKWAKLVGLVFFVVLLAYSVWWLFSAISTGEKTSNEEGPNNYPEVIDDTLDFDYTNPIPPTVEVTEPEFDGKNYSVFVEAKHMPKGMKIYYVRMNHFGEHKVLQKSEDGHFTDIPFNTESGNSYDFAIMNARTDTLLCDPVPVTGFIRQVIVNESERMSKEQLQRLIDSADESLMGIGENDYLAPDYILTFHGLSSDEAKPSTFSEIRERIIFGIWSKVEVTSIGYDDKNRIKDISLKVYE